MKKLFLALSLAIAALLTSCETAQVTVRTQPTAAVVHRSYVEPSPYFYGGDPFYQPQPLIYRERTRVIHRHGPPYRGR